MRVKSLLPLGALALTCACFLNQQAFADEAALQRQITQLRQDIAALKGEVEQLRYLVNSSQNIASNTGSASRPSNTVSVPLPDNVVNQAQNQANNANNAVAPGGATSSLKGVDAAAQQLYNSAYAKVQANDLAGAQTAFQNYVDTYPDNALTPNAWYWLGQVQYSRAIYDQARLSFLNVARYNDSQKRPDALYKLGMINKFVGDNDKALRYFQLVVQSYPNDAAATLANRELQRLQQGQ